MTEGSSAGSSSRLGKANTANMLRSLLPLIVLVLAMAYFCSPHNLDPVNQIDPANSIRYAASIAEVPLQVPALPGTWRPTSDNVVAAQDGQPGPITLTIGYVTPTEEFARYIFSTDPAAQVISDLLIDAHSQGSITLGGDAWEEFTTSRGERLLLRTDGAVRIVVTGSASNDELDTLAASLVPYLG